MEINPTSPSFLDGPAGRLRVDDGGRGGLPVVFVHGNGGNRTQWSAQLKHLRSRRRAVALDLRGFGESEPATDGDYSVAAFVDDVAAVVDALRLRRFVLAGHSYGGAVVGAYAGRQPGRTAGLLLVDPAGDLSRAPRGSLREWLDRLKPDTYGTFTREWFEDNLIGARDEVKESVLRALRETPREVFVGAIEGLSDYDPVPALESFPGPKLAILTGKKTETHSLRNLVEDLPFHLMAGACHWLMMDRPAEFNRLMDEFLDRVEGSAEHGTGRL